MKAPEMPEVVQQSQNEYPQQVHARQQALCEVYRVKDKRSDLKGERFWLFWHLQPLPEQNAVKRGKMLPNESREHALPES